LYDISRRLALVLDATGAKVNQYAWSAFGEQDFIEETVWIPWRWVGKRLDSETGWFYFGKRYYDPSLGRWTTPDPLGPVDGPNLYAYVRNRPLSLVDLDGLKGLRWKDVRPYVITAAVIAGVVVGGWLAYHYYVVPMVVSSVQAWVDDSLSGSQLDPANRPTVEKAPNGSDPAKYIPNAFGLHINGICNSIISCGTNTGDLSRRMQGGWYDQYYVSAPSRGFFGDVVEVMANHMGLNTPRTLVARELMQAEFAKRGAHGCCMGSGHSGGSAALKCILQHLGTDLRSRVTVRLFGNSSYISDDLCENVRHYVHPSDFVPKFFDRDGRRACADSIVRIDWPLRNEGAVGRSLEAHCFMHPMYNDPKDKAIKDFINYARSLNND
jgi:RHS repeat-associated protein